MNVLFVRFCQKPFSRVCILTGLILLGGCTTKKGPPLLCSTDVEMNRLAQEAKSLFEMQRPNQAAPLYQAALDRARALNNDVLIARLSYNLGACRLESGDVVGACSAFEESIHAASAAGLSDNEAQVLLGQALLKQGKTDQTLALCSKSIALQVSTDMRIRFQLLQSEAYLQAGEIDRAEMTLKEVKTQMTPKSALVIQAQAAHVEGVIRSRREQPSLSAESFLREAEFRSLVNRPIEVVSALINAANELKQAKNMLAEADCRYRAARALLALGHLDAAAVQLKLLEAMPHDQWPPSLGLLVEHLRQGVDLRASGPRRGGD